MTNNLMEISRRLDFAVRLCSSSEPGGERAVEITNAGFRRQTRLKGSEKNRGEVVPRKVTQPMTEAPGVAIGVAAQQATVLWKLGPGARVARP